MFRDKSISLFITLEVFNLIESTLFWIAGLEVLAVLLFIVLTTWIYSGSDSV